MVPHIDHRCSHRPLPREAGHWEADSMEGASASAAGRRLPCRKARRCSARTDRRPEERQSACRRSALRPQLDEPGSRSKSRLLVGRRSSRQMRLRASSDRPAHLRRGRWIRPCRSECGCLSMEQRRFRHSRARRSLLNKVTPRHSAEFQRPTREWRLRFLHLPLPAQLLKRRGCERSDVAAKSAAP